MGMSLAGARIRIGQLVCASELWGVVVLRAARFSAWVKMRKCAFGIGSQELKHSYFVQYIELLGVAVLGQMAVTVS